MDSLENLMVTKLFKADISRLRIRRQVDDDGFDQFKYAEGQSLEPESLKLHE